jgi:hypothetical protein
MVAEGVLPQTILEDFPDGLEVEVTSEGLGEFGLDLGIDPEAVRAVYRHLAEAGKVPESGVVDGAALEQVALEVMEGEEEAPPRTFGPESLDRISGIEERQLPEPEMTDGEEPTSFLRELR